jgi:hypothetical protein
MLIGLFIGWLLMSGSDPHGSAWLLKDVARTRASVSRVVIEPKRRDDVLKTLDQMKAVDDAHAARTKSVHDQVLADAASRSTSSADLVKQLEVLEADGLRAAERLIDLRFAAKDRMTREEWQAVFKKDE